MKQKDLLFIIVSASLVVGLWIVFSVVHNALSSTISTDTAANITQINGSFDTKTVHALKNREDVNPQTGIALTPTPTPTPTVAPITPVSPLQSFTIPIASQGGKTQ